MQHGQDLNLVKDIFTVFIPKCKIIPTKRISKKLTEPVVILLIPFYNILSVIFYFNYGSK